MIALDLLMLDAEEEDGLPLRWYECEIDGMPLTILADARAFEALVGVIGTEQVED